MKEFTISNIQAGQRFDKYLAKCLPNASKSFIYKMLRKKNITLNNKKADGSEKILQGDVVKLFFADDTYNKFAGVADSNNTIIDKDSNSNNTNNKKDKAKVNEATKLKVFKECGEPQVIFEDDDILLINKPSGMLSQKAEQNDYSLVEYVSDYLLDTGYLSESDLQTFHPGICNRLDRNTSGIVAAGKTITGLQNMSNAFKERTLHKYYICIVNGKIDKRATIKGYLIKDSKTNKVSIYNKDEIKSATKKAGLFNESEALPIETEYIPVCYNNNFTLLKVNLITGRSHQIRAHLASCGHAIIGDMKYGNKRINEVFKKKYNISNQMLHAYELDIPKELNISERGLNIKTEIPKEFIEVIKGENLWQPGIQEVLGALH